MSTAMQTALPHWPPIGATSTLISRYERLSDENKVPTTQVGSLQEDAVMNDPVQVAPKEGMAPTCSSVPRPLSGLTDASLKQELQRIQNHLQETPSQGFPSLRQRGGALDPTV